MRLASGLSRRQVGLDVGQARAPFPPVRPGQGGRIEGRLGVSPQARQTAWVKLWVVAVPPTSGVQMPAANVRCTASRSR